jgi:hypothetical protein
MNSCELFEVSIVAIVLAKSARVFGGIVHSSKLPEPRQGGTETGWSDIQQ